METIEITKENYLSLRKAYRAAVKEGRSEFIFMGQTLLIDYAKHVLQYMETFEHIKPFVNKPGK